MVDGDGRISGNDATKFFALSNLSRSQLKQLWALADVKRQGFLGFTEFVTAMQSGPDERSIPGNTIAVDADMPFGGLTTFGGSFLSKFQCSQMPHPLLDEVTFVDTPGVLSGEKQRTQRSYDFTGVVSWFAAKCDLILLLFDPHKLDISDEFKRVIASLHGNDDKIRVVLNKADQVDTQQPMDEGFVSPLGQDLFEKEQNNLLADLMDIPKKACDRRINEFVKRARSAKIHAYIISHLKKEMPAIMGKAKARQRLLDNLEEEFAKVQREFHLPAGDFPNVEHFREVLNGYNIDKFEKLKPKMIQASVALWMMELKHLRRLANGTVMVTVYYGLLLMTDEEQKRGEEPWIEWT
ncbi:hypothetical protein JHK85_024225 [Glycine max]|nr:hypothetical protein JHK85_024225 [Glycine max]